MIDATLGAIAVAALLGWTALLVLMSRATLPAANALASLQKVDALIDDRISRTVERIMARQERKAPAIPSVPSTPNDGAAAALRNLFGGDPLEPMGEQPESEGLEIVG